MRNTGICMRPKAMRTGKTEMDTVMTGQPEKRKLPENRTVPPGYRVPVLVYHGVGDAFDGEPVYFVHPKDMEEHIVHLRSLGYTYITFDDLPEIAQIEKPVIMTFDDGYADNYYNLFPLLKKYRVKAVLSVICDEIGTKGKLTARQIREMSDSGLVSVQSHTMSHQELDTMSEAKLEYELSESKRRIGLLTEKEPSVICYPMGRCSASVLRCAERYYSYGIAGTGDCFVTGRNPYEIERFFMYRGLAAEALGNRISGYES